MDLHVYHACCSVTGLVQRWPLNDKKKKKKRKKKKKKKKEMMMMMKQWESYGDKRYASLLLSLFLSFVAASLHTLNNEIDQITGPASKTNRNEPYTGQLARASSSIYLVLD
jgi:hypothetical protein